MTSTNQHSAPRQEGSAHPPISPYEGHGEGHRSAVRIVPTEGGLLVLPFQLMPALEQDRRHLIRSGKPTVNSTIPGQPSDILVSSSTTEHGLLHRILTVYNYHPGGRYMMNRSPLSIACLPRPHLSYCPPVETAHGHRNHVNVPGCSWSSASKSGCRNELATTDNCDWFMGISSPWTPSSLLAVEGPLLSSTPPRSGKPRRAPPPHHSSRTPFSLPSYTPATDGAGVSSIAMGLISSNLIQVKSNAILISEEGF